MKKVSKKSEKVPCFKRGGGFLLFLIATLLFSRCEHNPLNKNNEHAQEMSALTFEQESALQCIENLRNKTKNWAEVSDEDLKTYKSCKEEYYGLSADSDFSKIKDEIDNINNNIIDLGKQPSELQVSLLQEWFLESLGRMEIEWNGETGTLNNLKGVLSPPLSTEPKKALEEFIKYSKPKTDILCGFDDKSEWFEKGFHEIGENGFWQATFSRKFQNYRVEGDYLEIVLGPASQGDGSWRATSVSTHCFPGLDVAIKPSKDILAFEDAQKIAVSSFSPYEEPLISPTSELFIAVINQYPHLVWAFHVYKQSDARFVYIDAYDGTLLKSASVISSGTSHSGQIRLNVRRPYVSGTLLGAFGYAYIYENDADYPNSYLSTTNVNGQYSNVNHPNQGDHLWEIFFSGQYSYDHETISVLCSIAAGLPIPNYPTNLPGFSADGGVFYPVFSDQVFQRRGEFYYNLNYSRDFALAAWNPTQTFLPIYYYYYPIDICNAGASGAGFICVFDDCDLHPSQEQFLRLLIPHEYGHTLHYKAQNGASLTCELCPAWQEGFADFFSYLVNRAEFFRSQGFAEGCGADNVYIPGQPGETDDFYQDDIYELNYCVTNPHDSGNIFSGLYLDLSYLIGWRESLARVLEHLEELNQLTTWVRGSNSFYNNLLSSDCEIWEKCPFKYEIGRAFKAHDDTMSLSEFYWKDQWPSYRTHYYFFLPRTTPTTISSGEEYFLPRLAFDYLQDIDYFYFYLQNGVTYTFKTTYLCSNIDPIMTLFKMTSGNEEIITTNDNCDGLNPCITHQFTGEGEWRGIKIWEVNDNTTGCYDFQFYANDDVGNSARGSRAIAPNGAWYNGSFEQVGDVDWYKIYVNSAGSGVTLNIQTCEQVQGQTTDTKIELFYQDNLTTPVVINDDGCSCGCPCSTCSGCSCRASKLSYSVPSGKSGFYFLKVYEYNNDQTGNYKVTANLTGGSRDVGGSNRSTAFYLTNNNLAGTYLAADFESGSDEDWFRFYLYEREHVTFETYDLIGADTFVYLQDDLSMGYQRIPNKDGNPNTPDDYIMKDDDGAYEPLASHVHFVSPKAGTYYLRVRPYGYPNGATGAYSITMMRLGNYAPVYPAFP